MVVASRAPGFIVTLACIACMNVAMNAQSRASVGYRATMTEIDGLARQASGGDEHSVQALTDAIVKYSIVRTAAESIRNRLVRNEVSFRHGLARPVSESDLVTAFSAVGQLPGAPDFVRTSLLQVHSLRRFFATQCPSLVGATNIQGGIRPTDIPKTMSPSEAMFITLSLVNQKLSNPAFQIAPEEWDKRVAAASTRGGRMAARPKAGTQAVLVMPDGVADIDRAIRLGIADESSDVVKLAHNFMDKVGLSR